MIKKFVITNPLDETIELVLTDPKQSGFLVRSVNGLGPVKAEISTSELVTGDGSMFNSSRLQDRNIVFDLMFYKNENSIEDIRHISYEYFPVKQQITIEIYTDTRHLKTIGWVESNEPDIWSQTESASISIICPDPYFHAVTEEGDTSETIAFYEQLSGFEFPFENNSLTDDLIEFGNFQIDTRKEFRYVGDSSTGITIQIHALGNITNPVIYHVETDSRFEIDTSKLNVDDTTGLKIRDDVYIQTVRGKKKVLLERNGITYSILNALVPNSKWPVLVSGMNTFIVNAGSGLENMLVSVEYDTLYAGV